MNINVLKSDFKEYLEQKNALSTKEMLRDESEISVFMHADEFKEYLKSEYGSDVSLESKDLSEILKLEIVDGKLVDPNSAEVKNDANILAAIEKEKQTQQSEENSKANGNSDDEAVLVSDTESFGEENNVNVEDSEMITNALNDLFANEDFAKAFDIENIDDIDDKTLNDILTKLNGYDNDSGNLTLDDIMGAVKEIKNGNFVFSPSSDENTKDSYDKASSSSSKGSCSSSGGASSGGGVSSSGGASSVGGGGGVSSSGGSGTAVSNQGSYTNSTQGIDTDSKTLEELEQDKQTEQSNLDGFQSELESVQDGTNAEIAAQKKDMDSAKEEYDEALEKASEDNPELAAKKEEKETNEQAIQENETKTQTAQNQLNEIETNIINKQGECDALEGEISALDEALASYDGVEITDENRSEIEAAKSEIQSQKSAKEQALRAAQAALKGFEDQKKAKDDEIKTLQEENKTLTTQRDEIEKAIAEIAQNSSEELAKALESYQGKRESFETAKTTQTETVQGKITESQASLKEINTAIAQKKKEQQTQATPGYMNNDIFNALLHSNTATERGLDNTPGEAEKANLEKLIENTLSRIEKEIGHIEITSGYRSPAVNSAVGGVPNSQHRLGQACDFHIEGMTIQQVYEKIQELGIPYDQLINEGNQWIHISYNEGNNRQSAFHIANP